MAAPSTLTQHILLLDTEINTKHDRIAKNRDELRRHRSRLEMLETRQHPNNIASAEVSLNNVPNKAVVATVAPTLSARSIFTTETVADAAALAEARALQHRLQRRIRTLEQMVALGEFEVEIMRTRAGILRELEGELGRIEQSLRRRLGEKVASGVKSLETEVTAMVLD